MPFSKCRDVVDRASIILDGEAGVTQRMRFRAHLMMCGDCRRYFRQMRRVVQTVSEIGLNGHREGFEAMLPRVIAATRDRPEEAERSDATE